MRAIGQIYERWEPIYDFLAPWGTPLTPITRRFVHCTLPYLKHAHGTMSFSRTNDDIFVLDYMRLNLIIGKHLKRPHM